MAKIVKLTNLLPADIVFELPGGDQHTFPGDPPLELIVKIGALFERSEKWPSLLIGVSSPRALCRGKEPAVSAAGGPESSARSSQGQDDPRST